MSTTRLTLHWVAPVLLGSAAACGVGDTSATAWTETTTPDESSTAPQEESSSTTHQDTSGGGSTSVDESSDDDSECIGGAVCGDGKVCGNEECDCGGIECTPQSFGEITCVDVEGPRLPGPITGGVLGCNPSSCRFDISMCTFCGDGEVNGNEQCEADGDIDATCAQLGAGAGGEVTCSDTCQLDTSACTDCAFEFDFEADTCPLEFTTASLQSRAGVSSWECGDPSVYGLGPGEAATGVFGTNLSGPYNADEISALVSPAIDTSVCDVPGLVLRLRHWHNFEGGDLNSDGGLVQASDGGVVWTTIAPIDGDSYDMDAVLDATHPPVDGQHGFSGNADQSSWGNSVFDLSDYAGSDSLQVRLVFGSNGSVQQGGWYIDWMTVHGSD